MTLSRWAGTLTRSARLSTRFARQLPNSAISVAVTDRATEVELEEVWRAIEADGDVRVIVLTGAGERAFCAGADMKNSGHQTGQPPSHACSTGAAPGGTS